MTTINHITKLLLLVILLSSCTGGAYNVLHQVPKKQNTMALDHEAMIPSINKGDELCISVTGLNEESAKYFRTSKERAGATGIECLYYEVDHNGNISLPIVGDVKVEDLHLMDVQALVTDTLARLVKDPVVRVSYVNYHVSIMGEVTNPGTYEFNTGKVTLYEAIAKAGGLKQFAKRDNVLIVREEQDSLKYARFDLTRSDVWESEFYYLSSKDLVMVESNSGRIANSNNLTSWASFFVGVGTIVAIIATK